MAKGRHRARRIRRGTLVLLVAVAVLALGTAGTTFAAVRYDQRNADRILPGVTVAGVAVGDMTRGQAIAAVKRVVDEPLGQTITITSANQTWTSTRGVLGMSADVPAAVDAALGLTDSYPWYSRVYHRWFGKPVHRAIDVPYVYADGPVADLVAQAQKAVELSTRDASFSLFEGTIVAIHSKQGRVLRNQLAIDALQAAVRSGSSSVKLPIKVTKPKVADADIGETIVVDVSRNMLFLYEGFKVIRTYPVATAMQGFVTPDGAWEVVNKVENPTWYNPAPDGWGKDEPLVIPPGPGNPLGTRALYLNAPGIRIHGTPSDSSIGSWASHGCIRMHITDSEALYPLVAIGTPVFIIGAPPWGVSSAPGPAG